MELGGNYEENICLNSEGPWKDLRINLEGNARKLIRNWINNLLKQLGRNLQGKLKVLPENGFTWKMGRNFEIFDGTGKNTARN